MRPIYLLQNIQDSLKWFRFKKKLNIYVTHEQQNVSKQLNHSCKKYMKHLKIELRESSL